MAKKKQPVDDLPSNSKSSRVAPVRETKIVVEERPIVEETRRRPVPRVRAVQKKRSFTQSIAEALVGDSGSSVGGYILHEVLLPAAKNTISEMVTSGIEMILYGESSGRSKRGRDRDRSTINYSGFSRRDRDDDRRERRRGASYRGDAFELSEIFFKDHRDAEDVLDELGERVKEFDEVSVADYFELAGLDGVTHAHYKHGWSDMRDAFITHRRHGWHIVLPPPEPLD